LTLISVTSGFAVFVTGGTGDFMAGVDATEAFDDTLAGFEASLLLFGPGAALKMSVTGERAPTDGECTLDAWAEFACDVCASTEDTDSLPDPVGLFT
jgi:hypothetical protein